MSAPPRLLPLIAVAIGGVLAVKALSGVQALPDLLSAASAHAEEAPGRANRKAHDAESAAAPLPPAATAAPRPPPACIQSPVDLAKEVGVTPGELQTLQNLQARRGQLDDRERALDTQLQLLAAAEAKVDAKLKAVNDVKGQIQVLLGQAGQQQQADVDRLVVVYEKMKPRDAAAVMATLDDKVRIPVAAKMKPAVLAAVLGQMPTLEAKKVTERLAERADDAKQALNAAAAAPPPQPDPAAQSSDPVAPTPAAKSRKAHVKKLARSEKAATPVTKAAADLAPAKTAAAPAPTPATTAAAAPTAGVGKAEKPPA